MSLHGSACLLLRIFCTLLTQFSTAGGIYFSFSSLVVTIGFNGTYSVREDVGGISIVVSLMNSLAKDTVVTLSTLDDTARGGFAHCL